MESFGNRRNIQQGEDWTLDILLSQSESEYIPYIVSSERQNPHFVITVASTKFEKINRYIKSWWLPLDGLIKLPRFNQTVPYVLADQESKITTYAQLKQAVGSVDDLIPYDSLYQYKYNNETYFVYCYKDDDDIYQLSYDYECRITFNLSMIGSNKGTSEWSSQNYNYQITLVSGEKMADYIKACKAAYPDLDWRADWPTDDSQFETWLDRNIENVFNFIKKRIPEYFQQDITWDSPLGRIWAPAPILKPTELTVDNNLGLII